MEVKDDERPAAGGRLRDAALRQLGDREGDRLAADREADDAGHREEAAIGRAEVAHAAVHPPIGTVYCGQE